MLFLIVFSVAIAMGSMLVNRLLKGEVSARYVPISALVMSAFMIELWLSTTGTFVAHATPASTGRISRHAGQLADPCRPGRSSPSPGGMFIVPLYAILQTTSPPDGTLAHHRREQHRQRGGHRCWSVVVVDPAGRGRQRAGRDRRAGLRDARRSR